MNAFKLHVKLVGPIGQDHETVRRLMEQRGFAFETLDTKEKNAQYRYAGSLTMEAVLDLALAALKATGRHFFLFVTDPTSGRGSGTAG
jgi:hypothetical protein